MATTSASTTSSSTVSSSTTAASADDLQSLPVTENPLVEGELSEPPSTTLAEAPEPITELPATSSDPLKAERRRSNQLEKEIRTLRQQLNRFSEINPEEYARLQEAERQKQVLEQQLELRERQMEEASAQKVAAVAAERDEARQQILQLRKDRLLERAFSEAEGRTGGDSRGTFFDIFKGQLGASFRLGTDPDGRDVLEPLDSQGKPLLGDDGRAMTATDFLDQMRVHPVYGFLFQQRGPAGIPAAAPGALSPHGEPINPQAMSASELYRASFAVSGRSPARR